MLVNEHLMSLRESRVAAGFSYKLNMRQELDRLELQMPHALAKGIEKGGATDD